MSWAEWDAWRKAQVAAGRYWRPVWGGLFVVVLFALVSVILAAVAATVVGVALGLVVRLVRMIGGI